MPIHPFYTTLALWIICQSATPLLSQELSPDLSTTIPCRMIRLFGENRPLPFYTQHIETPSIEFYDLPQEKLEAKLVQRLETHFLHRSIDMEFLSELSQILETFYREERSLLAEVVIPEQEITDGVVQVLILQSRIAHIFTEGADAPSMEKIKRSLGIASGTTIDTSRIRKNINFLNRDPFRQVDLVYSPGPTKQTTNISLIVENRRNIRAYAGADNSGVETTGRARWLTGADFAHLFGSESFLTYQYTASYDLHKFQAHMLQSMIFLPWHNLFNIYGGYSTLHAHLPSPAKRNHGQSFQASGRYIIPLTPKHSFEHELSFGFDFKRTNNTLEFAETSPIIGPSVNLSQFTLKYSGHWSSLNSQIKFQTELFCSPGPLLGDESNTLYQTLRPGATNRWIYGKATIKWLQTLPYAFTLSLLAEGQLASQNLLPSEQLGLGGMDSVRGYDQRQLNYDGGALFNLELHAPSFAVFSRSFQNTSWKDAMQFLVFVDYGYGGNHTAIGAGAEKKIDYLLGTGPGIRYTLGSWLTARLDFGIKLHREALFTGGNAMWQFSIIGNI